MGKGVEGWERGKGWEREERDVKWRRVNGGWRSGRKREGKERKGKARLGYLSSCHEFLVTPPLATSSQRPL